MGGSGGSDWSSSYSGQDSDGLLNRANEQTDSIAYNSEVNGLLQEALKEFNDRPKEAIDSHIKVLKQAIEKDIENAVKLIFGGSINKKTFINGLSDVDSLVLINNTYLENKSPREVLEYFAQQIQQRLPETEVSIGELAVTIKYSDRIEVQILPAIKTSTGFKIASTTRENQWSNVIRHEAFARKLTEVNQACSGKVVPVVKLFKVAVDETLPANLKLSGYHAESLAIEAFKNYEGNRTYKDMLAHLCRTASKRVKAPIKDRTGQSLHVDDYLGSENSQTRNQVCSWLSRLATRLGTADKLRSLEDWQKLFDRE